MTKILITTSSFETKEALEKLRVQNFEVVLNPHKRKVTPEELRELLPGVIGLIAGTEKIDRGTMKNSQLKVISRVGTGTDSIDLVAAEELGIAVRNTPDAPITAVAELTLGSLLSLLRRIHQMNHDLHIKTWDKKMGVQLAGKTVLIIGFGRIGKYLAKLLEPFKVKLLTVDSAIQGISLKEALPQADIVSLHMSGSQQVLGKDEFLIMKDGVYILNVARGGAVDETALIESLKTGKVAGAWLDVFSEEPYSGPLAEFPQVILTPHIGSYTKECRTCMEIEAVDNLLKCFLR
ncbi:MAG: NAD(P)-dependent oxidoreductase [bacterium]|nr:NAD(P)-dependent oxidoreductase [bacterium]